MNLGPWLKTIVTWKVQRTDVASDVHKFDRLSDESRPLRTQAEEIARTFAEACWHRCELAAAPLPTSIAVTVHREGHEQSWAFRFERTVRAVLVG